MFPGGRNFIRGSLYWLDPGNGLTSELDKLCVSWYRSALIIQQIHELIILSQAKQESSIARLEAELNELKTSHRKEVDRLTKRAETTSRELKDAKNQLRDKDQVKL